MSEPPVTNAPEPATDPNQDVAPSEAEFDPTEKLVPVSEAIRYRKRAQAAEQQLSDIQQQMQQHEQQLESARDTIDRLERRQRIDAMLNDSEPVDLGVARLLTEQAVEQMDEPDVELAIRDLRRHKPYLFQQRAMSSPAMAPRLTEEGHRPVENAAERASESGSRRDLLDYLRLRRRA